MGACVDRILMHAGYGNGSRSTFTTENDGSVCEGCPQTFTSWRKKKICDDCGRNFCLKCIDQLKKNPCGFNKLGQCKKCQTLSSGVFTWSELMDWKMRDLRAPLHKCKVDISACSLKEDLIDAIFTNFGRNNRNGNQSPRNSQSTATPTSSSQIGSQGNEQTDLSTMRQSNQQQEQQQCLNVQQWEQQQQQVQMTGELLLEPLRQQEQEETSSSQMGSERNQQTNPSIIRQSNQQKQEQQECLNDQQQELQQQHVQMTGELLPEPQRQQQQGEISSSQMDSERNQQTDPSAMRESNQEQQCLNGQQGEQQQHHALMTELLLEALRQEWKQEVAQSSQSDNTKNDTSQESETQIIAIQITLDDINSEKEIDSLSIKQLKKLLLSNFVDYKGCCERWELEERVRKLWKEDQINKRKAEEVRKAEENPPKTSSVIAMVTGNEDDICRICMDATIDCVLLECGHMVTCTSCGKQLAECPICRQYVSRVVHVFKS